MGCASSTLEVSSWSLFASAMTAGARRAEWAGLQTFHLSERADLHGRDSVRWTCQVLPF